ncbi:DNA-binding protein SMUBP-2-like [Bolinopsis microptera]|uniref:DNA-binding protein SMUBP-2-like n=1 Tax=Bolinopsis microptera TaxID=2820187 RepID=UPI00307AC1CC
MLTVERFVKSQRELLGLEQDEETEQSRDLLHGQSAKDLEKEGVCVTKLFPASIATGLYGRRVLKLTRENLPNHSFSSGDIAGLSHKDLTIICEGIVSKVGKDSISVAFEEFSDDVMQMSRVSLLKLTNSVTYSRYLSTLKIIEKNESDLVDRLLSEDIRAAPTNPNEASVTYCNDDLNSGQKQAVKLTLERPDMAVIHGPPGTGKTTTIVEVVRQHVARGEKVLVCAPSNIAVDNLLKKLSASNTVVRLGHPARVNVNLQQFTLDAKLKNLDEDNILGDVRKDIDQAIRGFRGNKSGNKSGDYQSRKNVGELRKELRERELKATKQVLTSSQVVLCTLTSAGKRGPLGKLPDNHFSVCVIDEASQALEVACWMGILNAKKVILAGDHLQLPPTIKSDKAAKEGLSQTLMERILNTIKCPDEVCTSLTEQYRMNELIMRWSSEEMYAGKLTAHSSVSSHVLSGLKEVESTEITTHPLCFVDTAGSGLFETLVGVSRGNKGEAKLVVEYLTSLKEAGVKEADMAVITPYNLQIEFIRAEMMGRFKEVEVCSVDGFQGREKEAIVITMVRSNDTGEIGFLSESRRMNVAVTRARRHVCLIGDSLTVKRDAFLGRLVAYFTRHGLVKSAFEYGLEGVDEEEIVHTQADSDPEELVSDSKNAVSTRTLKQETTFKQTSSKKLEDYKETDRTEGMAFPGLNSYQRRIIHVLCEELGLFSTSTGSGNERILCVYKTSQDTEKEEELVQSEGITSEVCSPSSDNTAVIPPPVTHNDDPNIPTPLSSLVVCKQCGARVPKANIELHLVRCKPKTFTTPTPSQNQKRNKSAASGKKKKKDTPKQPQPSTDDDFSVLDDAVSSRLACPITGCQNPCISYISPCRFCASCHCSEHQMPEVHGCGAAARRDAQLPDARVSVRQQAKNKTRLKQALKDKQKERTKAKK